MHPSVVLSLFAAGVANAAGQQLVPGSNSGFSPVAGLLARQFGDCTIRSTCHACFGDGYVICDKIGCFNPDIHQQCCSNALLCVGQNNSCCEDWGGPGETGTSGVPDVMAAPTPTGSDTSYYSCYRDDEGEDCCQRAQIPLHWCSGDFPNFRCYNDKNQFCCTDGTVCDLEGCCDLFDASTTHPWASGATITPGASQTTAATNSITEAPTSAATDSAEASESSTSTSGASRMVGPGLAIGLAALALGLL